MKRGRPLFPSRIFVRGVGDEMQHRQVTMVLCKIANKPLARFKLRWVRGMRVAFWFADCVGNGFVAAPAVIEPMRETFVTYRRVLLFCGVSLAAWFGCAVAHLFPDGPAAATAFAVGAPPVPALLAPVHPAVVAGNAGQPKPKVSSMSSMW